MFIQHIFIKHGSKVLSKVYKKHYNYFAMCMCVIDKIPVSQFYTIKKYLQARNLYLIYLGG